MSTEDKTLKIYLNSDNKDAIIEGASSSEKYIIEMNSILQKKDHEQTIEIKELQMQVEELEEDRDSLEKKNDYLKGLLKNFHEMNKNYKALQQNSKEMFDKSRKSIEEYIKENRKKIRLVEILSSILFSFIFWKLSMYTFISYSFLVGSFLIYFEYFINGVKFPDMSKRIRFEKDTLITIKKTEKAQDYIHEFIDSC